MEAIIRAFPDHVRVVVAPKEDLPAVAKARDLGIPVVIAPPDQPDILISTLKEVHWVCLAGYLRLLPVAVLESHPNRVLNIHPALLPKFGGKGMYGLHVHTAVLAAGEQSTGCTVHYVSEHYDEGAIILQKQCAVFADDTPETLAARVLNLETQAYVEALQKLINHG